MEETKLPLQTWTSQLKNLPLKSKNTLLRLERLLESNKKLKLNTKGLNNYLQQQKPSFNLPSEDLMRKFFYLRKSWVKRAMVVNNGREKRENLYKNTKENSKKDGSNLKRMKSTLLHTLNNLNKLLHTLSKESETLKLNLRMEDLQKMNIFTK